MVAGGRRGAFFTDAAGGADGSELGVALTVAVAVAEGASVDAEGMSVVADGMPVAVIVDEGNGAFGITEGRAGGGLRPMSIPSCLP